MIDLTLRSVSPRAFDNVYHVAYLVPDLFEAMEELRPRLQVTWTAPFEMPSGLEDPDGDVEDDPVRIVYSNEGPPYLELIEVVSRHGAMFAEPAAGGFHHLGIYAHSWRDEVRRLVEAGMVVERWGTGTAFVRDPQLGVRYEIVSFKGRDFLDRILSGEMADDHPVTVGPRRG